MKLEKKQKNSINIPDKNNSTSFHEEFVTNAKHTFV